MSMQDQMMPGIPQGDPGMDPMQGGGAGSDPTQMMVPIDHDPFDDPEHVQAILRSIALVEQRMFSMELSIAQGVHHLTGALAQMGQDMSLMRAAYERLRQTMAAPKRIVRDAEGRPQGVVIEEPPQ